MFPPSSLVGCHGVWPGGQPAIDSDISHWNCSSIYIGVGLEGSVTQTIRLSGVNVVQTLHP